MTTNDEETVDEFSERIETLEKILQNYYQDKFLKVLSIDCKPGSRKGDNYMSIIKRVFVKFKKSHETSESTISLIVKRHILNEEWRSAWRCEQAFQNEIAAYSHLIPEFNKLYDNTFPYPSCLFAGTDECGAIIVMEDLGKKGYKMANRLQGLDFDHCTMVMKQLGNFHGTSLAMKLNNSENFFNGVQKINEVVFDESAADFYSHVLETSLNEVKTSLNNAKNSKFNGAIEKLKALKSGKHMFYIMMNDVMCNDKPHFMVVTHGDLWINNIMFHYDESGKVDHAKFVDLQTIRYGNMVCDLLIFLFSSTKAHLRLKYLDDLLEIYRTSLLNSIRNHLSTTIDMDQLQNLEEIYSLQNIKDELALRSFFGLGMSFWLMPAITFLPNIKNIDSLMETIMDNDKHDEIMMMMQSNEYHVRIQEIVSEYEIRGFLDNISCSWS